MNRPVVQLPGSRQRVGRPLVATRVMCMAHPRRVAKVAKQIEREIGTMLLFDRRLQEAVCPERRLGVDNAVSGLASVTEVVLSGDLQVAKVYLSIFSDDMGKALAMANLKKLEGYVRYNVGQQMRLRLVPEIRFIEDESLEKSLQVLKLLDQIKAERDGGPMRERPPIAIPGLADAEAEAEEEDEDGFLEDEVAVVDPQTAFADMERLVGLNPVPAEPAPRRRVDAFSKARSFKDKRPGLPQRRPRAAYPEGYLEKKYQREFE